MGVIVLKFIKCKLGIFVKIKSNLNVSKLFKEISDYFFIVDSFNVFGSSSTN